MSVPTQNDNRLERIKQVEDEISELVLKRAILREQLAADLKSQGKTLREVGEHFGVSHVAVHHMLKLHAARNEGRGAA